MARVRASFVVWVWLTNLSCRIVLLLQPWHLVGACLGGRSSLCLLQHCSADVSAPVPFVSLLTCTAILVIDPIPKYIPRLTSLGAVVRTVGLNPRRYCDIVYRGRLCGDWDGWGGDACSDLCVF